MKKLIYTLLTFLLFTIFFPTANCFSQNNRLWATYYGGTGNEDLASVVTDASGNSYLAGRTESASGIASGGFQNTFGGGSNGDVFLVKFDPSGNRLWATYYGGSGDDVPFVNCVAVDASGNVYLAGNTNSTSGIASGGFQNIFGGGQWDAFLVKFDPAGNRLWSTYYGEIGTDGATSICTDVSGNIYLAGGTNSTSGIASGGFQNTFGGDQIDAFLVKFDPAGTRLWATYYGGLGNDYVESNITDASGNIYLAGHTNSSSDIASGGFQNTFGGGWEDAFLVKFNSSGVRLWATYYGGGALFGEYGRDLATDLSGNVYLTGATTSPTGIASGGFQNTIGSGTDYDAFLVKFDPLGNRLWATYYGGTWGEVGRGLATDASGNVYLSGDVCQNNGPATSNSTTILAFGGFQNNMNGLSGAFLVKFDTSGNRLCATYYDAENYCTGWNQVALDQLGNVFFAGSTQGNTDIASGGFQNTIGGQYDCYLVKFTSCFNVLSATATSINTICNGQCTGTGTANPTGGTPPYTYSWNTTPIQTTQTAIGLCVGNYTVTVTDAANNTTTATATITQPPAVGLNIQSYHISCHGACDGVAIANPYGGVPGYTYLWSTGQTTSSITGLCVGNYTGTITDANGCSQLVPFTSVEPLAITLTSSSTPTNCNGNTGTATATVSEGISPYTYLWLPSGGTNINATGLSAGSYTLTITDANGCTQTETVVVAATGGPTANAGSNLTINPGSSTPLNATGGGTYSWSPATGLSCTNCANPVSSPSSTTDYCVTVTDANGCIDSACVRVIVMVESPCPTNDDFVVPTAFSPNNDGHNDLFILHGFENCITTFSLIIYDRWGEKVFETQDASKGWDGTYNGKPMNQAVFVYYIKATLITGEKITKKGNISLIR